MMVADGFAVGVQIVLAVTGLITIGLSTSYIRREEIDHAELLGLDTIVLDHHAIPPVLPRAIAVVAVLLASGRRLSELELKAEVEQRLRQLNALLATPISRPRRPTGLGLAASIGLLLTTVVAVTVALGGLAERLCAGVLVTLRAPLR